MKIIKYTAPIILAAQAFSATLDVTGWRQIDANGTAKSVVITGVASGEVPFFTNNPAQITSRRIVSTDISDSTAIGKQILTAVDANAVRSILGISSGGGGATLQASYIGFGDGSNGLSGESVFTYDSVTNRMFVQQVQLGTALITYSSADTFQFSGTTGSENFRISLATGNTATVLSTSGINQFNFSGIDISVPGDAYDEATWNNNSEVPTKNDVRDKIESLSLSGSSSLTAGYVGFGDGSNVLSGNSNFTYNAGSNTLSFINGVSSSLKSGNIKLIETEGVGSNTVELYSLSDFSADRRLGLAMPDADTEITFPQSLTVAGTNIANSWGDGAKQTLNPNGTNAGLNFGAHTANPSSPENGDAVYRSDLNYLNLRINGTDVSVTESALGVAKAGTRASPITTNPYSPTWLTNDLILYYGATGTINLPPAATYTNKTVVPWITGSFNVTINPNGSETIIENGVSLGAGVDDLIAGAAGTSVAYVSDGTSWIKFSGGGGGGSSLWDDIVGKPTTLSGYGITDAQPLDPDLTQFAALADPNADRLIGWDDSAGAYVQYTAGPGLTISGTTISATGALSNSWTALGAGTALSMNTNYYVSLNANRTFTFSGGPTEGDRIRVRAIVSSGPVTVTFPTSFRIGNSGTYTSIPLVDGDHMLVWEYINSLWMLSDSSTDYEDAYTVYGNFSGGSAAPSFSNSGVLDFGPWTSFELPNNAAPTVDVLGEVAADNNLWASGRGALLHFDGTSTTALLGVLTSDTPGTGEVPTYNSNGTITWEELPDSLLSSEVDSSAEVFTLVGDAVGSGSLLFNTNPLLEGTISWEGTTTDGFTIDITGEPTADRSWGVIDADGYIALFNGGPIASTRIPFGHSTDGTLATDSAFTFNSGTDTLAVPNLTLSTGGSLGASTATTPSAGDNDTSLATTAFVQNTVAPDNFGTPASPTTTNPLSPTWDGQLGEVWYGATGTINLPTGSTYDGKGIIIYNTGAFTITINPDDADLVWRDGSPQSTGVSFTLSSGAGNFVSIIKRGSVWVTLGYKGTLNVGS